MYLGFPTEVSAGNYLFTDPFATNDVQRFYTVLVPVP